MTINVEAEDAVGRIMEATGGDGVDTALGPYTLCRRPGDPRRGHVEDRRHAGGGWSQGRAAYQGPLLRRPGKQRSYSQGNPRSAFRFLSPSAVETIESRRYPLEKAAHPRFPRGGNGRGNQNPGWRDQLASRTCGSNPSAPVTHQFDTAWSVQLGASVTYVSST